MGTFLTTLSQDKTLKPNPPSIWSQPLSKIKQYHGMFKYICDCFVITTQQCLQIFGSLDKCKIWDPQSLGKIDALEIFCGLIIFAKNANFKKKISFLFTIFDFNQIKSLSFIDVEVIILNICNSVYKIFNKNGKANQNQISDWLNLYLSKKQRIKITTLYYFCLSNSQIKQFITLINNILDQPITFQQIPSNNETQFSNQQSNTLKKQTQSPISYKQKQQIKQSMQWYKKFINKIVKIQSFQHPFHHQFQKYCQSNYGCQISWVYGLNTQGQSKPFIPIKQLGQCILYRVSSMAIIYDLEINQQYIMDGHQSTVNCVAYNQKNSIIATVQAFQFPNINLWKRKNNGKYLIQSQKFIKYAQIPTNHSKGIKIMEFVAKQSLLATVGLRNDSPILLYDFIKLQVTHQILTNTTITNLFTPLILIQKSQVSPSILNTFFTTSPTNPSITKISLKNPKISNPKSPQQQLNSTQQLKIRQYPIIQTPNKITTAIACYLNKDNPSIRSYKQKSIDMIVITGHQSGIVCMASMIYYQQQHQIICNYNQSISCIQITSNILVIAVSTYICIYDIDVIINKNGPIFFIDLKLQQNIQLLNQNIHYFDLIDNFIVAITEQGQFLKLQTFSKYSTSNNSSMKKLQYQNQSYKNEKSIQPQLLKVTQINGLIKLYNMSTIFCILNWKQNQQIILYATNNYKIVAINSKTHQIQDIWEIAPDRTVVALDAVYSDKGIVYIVCACRNGQIYIRIDWSDEPKYYDCGCQIIDAKISKDCSYLLVATSNNYLLFFTQINSTFTSPRKLLFEYQTPCSINFLDNFKFFLVITSAKNSYLIQIPQLKHKKLQKQTQKISISKAYIRYPYSTSKKQTTYSNGCLGGLMKFSILTMGQKDIYFFNSHDALQRGNYVVLSPHKCPVSRISVNQEQSKFYSLGKNDDTLIQWSVFQTKSKKRKIITTKNQLSLIEAQKQNNQYFSTIVLFATYNNFNNNIELQFLNKQKNQTYFFKATKNQQLNLIIQKYYDSYLNQIKKKTIHKQTIDSNQSKSDIIQQHHHQINQQCTNEDLQYFKKRPPNISLSVKDVYGFATQHKRSIFYNNEGSQIMGFSSRFIIRMNLKTKQQIIYEPTNKKICFMVQCSLDGEILYAVVEEKPMIYLLCKGAIKTTHRIGIIHMSVYKNYVLSYGISEKIGENEVYSINLHNYHTGQLLHNSYTDIKVCEFILIAQNLAISLNEIRLWKNFYPSQPITFACAACILANNKDILLGLHDGRLAILTDCGIFQLHIQAHQSIIDILRIKHIQKYTTNNNNNNNFQIISIGRDQKIKIWTNNFQLKITIPFRQKSYIQFINQNNKIFQYNENIFIKSVDVYKNKILLVFNTGNVNQIQLQTLKNQKLQSPDDSINKLSHQTSMKAASFSERTLTRLSSSNQVDGLTYGLDIVNRQLKYKWNNICQLNSVRTKQNAIRRTFFSLNSIYPLIASSACQNYILIKNYQTNQLIIKYYFQNVKAQCVKFSPHGNLLALGLNNGEIRLYQLIVLKNQNNEIQNITLKLYQKFQLKIKSDHSIQNINYKNIPSSNDIQNKPIFSIINIQFSQCSHLFAVSFIQQTNKQLLSIINIYRTRQHSSLTFTQDNFQNITNNQRKQIQTHQNQIFYYNNLTDVIEIDNVQKNVTSYSNMTAKNCTLKSIKSSYFLSFCSQPADSLPTHLNSNQTSKSIYPFTPSQKKSQDKLSSQNKIIYLIIFEQFIDSNRIRINEDNKIKIKIYEIQDKIVLIQHSNINFFKLTFPLFIYARSFTINSSHLRNFITGCNGHQHFNYSNHHINDINKFGYQQDKTDVEIIISSMAKVGENLIYGDTKGKIHLVKLNSLLFTQQGTLPHSQNQQAKNLHPTMNLQLSAMNLSKTYSSLISFINQIQISSDLQYLFVSGGYDDCIVKYRLQLQQENQDLDSICYPFHFKDIHDQYLSKAKFYDFLNNIDPIRQEISDIMLDVQHQKKSNDRKTQLQPIRIYGRRAFDRRNNLYEDGRGNLIYSLGPNIIIQNPFDLTKQTYIKADPSQFSNSPQISCLNMSNKVLIVATEEQNSRLFVWDILSMTCLSELRLKNFSVVYHIVQSNCHKVVLIYGINNLYEASMQLVDWNEKRVLGSVNMMYSGCWKIKDICQFRYKDDGLQFVSCGMQHLVFWQYLAGTLVYSSFGLNNPTLNKITFMVVRAMDDIIVTGCQRGRIYLFKNFELIHEISIHRGPIRAMAIDNILIYSGGMDGRMCVSMIFLDENERYYIKTLEQYSIKDQNKNKNDHQKQTILAEQDIQSVVLTKKYSSKNDIYTNRLYIGTRSGNILLINRSSSFDPNDFRTSLYKSTNKNQNTKPISGKIQLPNTVQKVTWNDGKISPIIWSHDNDTIASVCFDQLNFDLFYLITFSGVLQIWSIKTLKRISIHNVGRQCNKIFSFNDYIIICCQKMLLTLKANIKQNKIRYIKQMSIQYDGIITDSCLSKPLPPLHPSPPKPISTKQLQAKRQSAILVLALKKYQYNQILIHDITDKITQRPSSNPVNTLKYQIQFIDFSRDNKYLLFKDSFQQLGMINLQNNSRINTIFVEMDTQWESQGIRISPSGQKIYCSYTRENKITVIRRLSKKQIIVGDEMGTLRIFSYPFQQQKLGQLHNQCYTTHMNFIKNIQIHPIQPYAITTAVYDRSLIIWKINRSKDQ